MQSSLQPLRQIVQAARDRHDRIDSYWVRLTRREVIRGKTPPDEVILFKFRKQPFSVFMKWIVGAGEGREITFVQDKFEGKLHTLLAAGDMPLTPAGKRLSLSPDSLFVRNASRHPITEAGVGSTIASLDRVLVGMEKGNTRAGSLSYLGLQKRDEFAQPLETVLHVLPPRFEPSLPNGGRRWIFFDASHQLPALIVTQDERGQEVEYYRYERFGFNVNLDDDDFDPDKLWPRK